MVCDVRGVVSLRQRLWRLIAGGCLLWCCITVGILSAHGRLEISSVQAVETTVVLILPLHQTGDDV